MKQKNIALPLFVAVVMSDKTGNCSHGNLCNPWLRVPAAVIYLFTELSRGGLTVSLRGTWPKFTSSSLRLPESLVVKYRYVYSKCLAKPVGS